MLRRIKSFFRNYGATCLVIFAVFAVLTGLAYPLFMTGFAQVAFKSKANGSIVNQDGEAVGSTLIGQSFTGPNYFHGRPSAAGTDGYDATASGGSNLGPTNPKLTELISQRADEVRKENGLAPDAKVPADLVEASASGLDPDISPQSATLQVKRVAGARNLPEAVVLELVKSHVQGRQLSVLGEQRVNVLELNLALDRMSKQI
ncbi:MAG TPA: potassium-transporting ATPase subunit KdpC [Candidatus Anoxymicrobiaceae bacterium]